ncbi:MAG: RdgB/HAM1 family non-canonical purine NTP pyrophosphatase [Salibacteraceae bacterium]
MKEIIFATNNAHKLREVQTLLGNKFELLSLKDIGFNEEIPETQPTIEGNATQKAEYIFNRYKKTVFADDTGLEIEALNGEPGVYSARYAGLECSFEDNCNKVLKNLEGVSNRKARFKTVISYLENGKEIQFEGIVNGVILENYHGEKGFGYDPIFLPDGHKESFAEMTLEQKNAISHRGLAVQKLVNHLLGH